LGLSVSRIGSKVQCPAIKEVSSELRLEYAQYREMLRLTKLRTHLSSEALERMRRGETLRELFIQPNNQPCSLAEEVILFYAFKRKILEVLPQPTLRRFINEFFENDEINENGNINEKENLKKNKIIGTIVQNLLIRNFNCDIFYIKLLNQNNLLINIFRKKESEQMLEARTSSVDVLGQLGSGIAGIRAALHVRSEGPSTFLISKGRCCIPSLS
jgi:hypothetical protein